MRGEDISIWHALAKLPAWETVGAQWREYLDTGYAALSAQKVVVPARKWSDDHPCTHKRPCGCWHKRRPGTDIMVCQCETPDCADFTIIESQLELYRLDTLRLADAVRELLSVKKPVRRMPEVEGVYSLGTYHPLPGSSYPVYLFMPVSDDSPKIALANLASTNDRLFAAVLFTRESLDPRIETALRGKVHFLFLDETITLGWNGTFELFPQCKNPLRVMHTTSTTELSEEDLSRVVQMAFKLSARRPKRGPTMLEYMQAVSENKTQSEIAQAYKCSRPQISALKKEFITKFGKNPELLIGRRSDLDDIVKTVKDSRAKYIDQWTASTGREEEAEE